jgi:hypothetical protein
MTDFYYDFGGARDPAREIKEMVPESLIEWLDTKGHVVHWSQDDRRFTRGHGDHNPDDRPIMATHDDWVEAHGEYEELAKLIMLRFDETQSYD